MKKVFSSLLSIVGILIALLGILFLKAALRPPPEYVDSRLLFLLIGIVFFSFGIYLWRISKRMKLISAAKALQNDKRSPVIYLRTFKDDKKASKEQSSALLRYMTMLASSVPQNLNTEEEQLAIAMKLVGPIICIGKPGEFLPPLGVPRDYVPDLEWRRKVMEYTQQASIILIRANETEGLVWEIKYVWTHIKRQKIIFLLPDTQKKAESFNKVLAAIIRREIPPYQVQWLTDKFSGLLYFDEYDNPKFIAMKDQSFRFGNLISIRLKKTFEDLPINLIEFNRFKVAGKKHRFFALLYDYLFMLAIAIIPFIVALYYYRNLGMAITTFWLSSIVFYFLYSFVMDIGNQGTTLGKKKYKLKLLDKEQIDATFQQLSMRTVAKAFSLIIFYVDVPLFLFTDKHIHDYLSATRVFKIPS